MTRFSSLLIASTLAILPLSAFAQQAATTAKTAEPTAMTTTAPAMGKAAVTTPVSGKAAVTATTKPDVKIPATGAKSEVHGMNTTTTGRAKTTVPAKPVEPAKS
jgi:hypothetical protein